MKYNVFMFSDSKTDNVSIFVSVLNDNKHRILNMYAWISLDKYQNIFTYVKFGTLQ